MSPWTLIQADARAIPLADGSVHCVVTSPPYWGLRDYGVEGQLGLEKTPEEYVAKMVVVFREVRRVLRNDGVVWLNLGDCYAGGAGKVGNCPGGGEQGERWKGYKGARGGHEGKHGYLGGANGVGPLQQPNRMPLPGLKAKDLVGIPWMVAFALRADGWYLRSDIVWSKPNAMPESVRDRPSRSHEFLFLLTKSRRYFYDYMAVREACQSGPSDLRKMREGLARFGGKSLGNQDKLNAASARTKVGRDRAVGDGTGRNKRSVWTVATANYKKAHFATFPTRLAEPCILAGTPEAGVCPDCGAPWRRIVKKLRRPTRPGEATKVEWARSHFHISRDPAHPTEANGKERADGMVVGNRDPERHVTEMVTVGWRMGCRCEIAPPVPPVVLDIFNGAGTTGLVATHHGRRYVGLDINAEYLRMSDERIRAGWNPPKPKKPRKPRPAQKSLFPMEAA